MANRHQTCVKFAKRYNLSINKISTEMTAIYWLEYSQELIAATSLKYTDRLILDPTWGLIQVMLDRTFEYASSSIILYNFGQYSSGEALSRTVYEAAINVIYVLMGDRVERLQEYLYGYIETEKNQNEKWGKSLTNLKGEEKQIHSQSIKTKEEGIISKSGGRKRENCLGI